MSCEGSYIHIYISSTGKMYISVISLCQILIISFVTARCEHVYITAQLIVSEAHAVAHRTSPERQHSPAFPLISSILNAIFQHHCYGLKQATRVQGWIRK